jgi:phosphatidylglycerophosphatase A
MPGRLARRLACFTAQGFGIGRVPVAPGTAGTLLAVPLYFALAAVMGPYGYAAAVFVLAAAGVWLCAVAERELGAPDHPSVVWDEIVGYLLTMFLAPPGWAWAAAGFVLFRLFDIWKPFPIGTLERRVRGGLGIMLDDLLAGVYAFAVLQALSRLAAF